MFGSGAGCRWITSRLKHFEHAVGNRANCHSGKESVLFSFLNMRAGDGQRALSGNWWNILPHICWRAVRQRKSCWSPTQCVWDLPLLFKGGWLVRTQTLEFLWQLSLVTKFSGTPASSKREILVLLAEWLETFFPLCNRPAFSAAFEMNFPISFLPSGEHLYQTAGFPC